MTYIPLGEELLEVSIALLFFICTFFTITDFKLGTCRREAICFKPTGSVNKATVSCGIS